MAEIRDGVLYLCMALTMLGGYFLGYSTGKKHGFRESSDFYDPKMSTLMEIVEEGNSITNKLVDENLHLRGMMEEKEVRDRDLERLKKRKQELDQSMKDLRSKLQDLEKGN